MYFKITHFLFLKIEISTPFYFPNSIYRERDRGGERKGGRERDRGGGGGGEREGGRERDRGMERERERESEIPFYSSFRILIYKKSDDQNASHNSLYDAPTPLDNPKTQKKKKEKKMQDIEFTRQ